MEVLQLSTRYLDTLLQRHLSTDTYQAFIEVILQDNPFFQNQVMSVFQALSLD